MSTPTDNHQAPSTAPRARLWIVDDDPIGSGLLTMLLKSVGYTVVEFSSGEAALEALSHTKQWALPNLIFLDVELWDGIDGFEACRQIKASQIANKIPIVFLTVKSEAAYEKKGLDAGAVDYITKPINPELLFARLRTHLTLKSVTDQLITLNSTLEIKVQLRVAEIKRQADDLNSSQEAIILALAFLAGARDNETSNHLIRTQRYVRALAKSLMIHPRFTLILTEQYVGQLAKAAPLHDLGKVGIVDAILFKPGKLTEAEFEIMKTHTTIGQNALLAANQRAGKNIPILTMAREIASAHHEKWNGSGYPLGLAGESIPLAARIMALADVYDAMRSPRSYKDQVPSDEATAYILAESGKHFDPDVVDAFARVCAEFQAIENEFSDH